jgi:glycosyltransferase involved in cell wall biosynthesis
MFIVEDPIISFNKERKNGISAFMRIKNGEDYLEDSILSVIDQVNEIICVFNDSIDNTEKILISLEEKYPLKIKVYKYIPIVYPPNSKEYLELPETSIQSLAYYYNFALSKTTFSYCFKLDDDQIYFPETIKKLKNDLEEEKNKNKFIEIRGFNLVDYKEKMYINLKDAYTASVDILFFKFNEKCNFFKKKNHEWFRHPYSFLRSDLLFYHTKRCKQDRGINNYLLNTNTNSRYNEININWFNDSILVSFDIYLKKMYPKNKYPEINYINNSNKKYNESIFTTLENNINESKIEINNNNFIKTPIKPKLVKTPKQPKIVKAPIQNKLPANKPIQNKLPIKIPTKNPIQSNLLINKPIQPTISIQSKLSINKQMHWKLLINKPIQPKIPKKK